jgi:hypothetical protein
MTPTQQSATSTSLPPPRNPFYRAEVLTINRSSILGSTASVSESIFEYRKLHGRTYQNFRDAEYWYGPADTPNALISLTQYRAPNDERQNEGLDIA